jgi:rhodanese-related sulfurtransferase
MILGHLYDAQLIPLNALENKTMPLELPEPAANDTFMLNVYQQIMNSFNLSAHINDPVIVYCKAGTRSAPACEILVEHGFTQVYNMIGGITAWMEAGYPIYTPYHHAQVNINDNQTTVNIEPWLLYTTNCTTCQTQSETCSTGTPLNSNDTIIEQDGNHTLILTTIEINGTIQEYLTEKTLLWQQNETSIGLNRTMALTAITTTSQNITAQAYSIYDQVEHNDYTITISTLLNSLDETTYNQSTTHMEYMPTGSKRITTVEIVDFNASITLSQLFNNLGVATDELGNVYAASEDSCLSVFAERYYILANEAYLFSHTVETQLSSYDKPILVNNALIEDGFWCDWCPVWCPGLIVLGCGLACLSGYAPGCLFCAFYSNELQLGCIPGCVAICALEDQGQTPGSQRYWISDVTAATWYGSQACHVWNENNICGAYSDNALAQIYAGNYHDQAVIVSHMSGDAHGDIWLTGYSVPGYYTDYQVWVSYDNVNWGSNPIYTGQIYDSQTVQHDFYGGYTSNTFRYIAIVCYDTGLSCNMFVDNVAVTG